MGDTNPGAFDWAEAERNWEAGGVLEGRAMGVSAECAAGVGKGHFATGMIKKGSENETADLVMFPGRTVMWLPSEHSVQSWPLCLSRAGPLAEEGSSAGVAEEAPGLP